MSSPPPDLSNLVDIVNSNLVDIVNNATIEADIRFYDDYLLIGDCSHSANTQYPGYCRNIHAKIVGNDIETHTVGEEIECADKCDINNDCKAFSYNTSNNECKLKNSYYNIQKNDVDDNNETIYTKKNVAGWNHMVSEGIRPEIIPCIEPEYDGVITDEYIKTCNDAALCMMRNKDLNVDIDRYNEYQQDAWRKSHIMWQLRKKEHDKRFLDWQNKEGEFQIWHTREQELKNEIKRTSTCSSDSRCPSEWVGWVGTRVGADCHFGTRRSDCRRTDAQVEKELNELGYQEVRPLQDYNLIEREPTQNIDFPYMLKTPNEETVQCCDNSINMVHGDATNVSQTCEQLVEQTDVLVNTPITEPNYTTTPPTTITTTDTSSTTTTYTPSTTVAQTSDNTEENNTTIMIIILGCIILSVLCLVSSVLYLNKKRHR
jgi:hypothetical protein